jgi:hypothetical protein
MGVDFLLIKNRNFQGLDPTNTTTQLRPLNSEITAPRIDSYRFSMANLQDSQDVDLDAILGELCALETQVDREIGQARDSKRLSGASDFFYRVTNEKRFVGLVVLEVVIFVHRPKGGPAPFQDPQQVLLGGPPIETGHGRERFDIED